ncbi:MAG TPA: NADPH-dependent F420 reductase [bacterium]|nr:NADPH-dependent F420 reductase [bacterium]
MSSLGPVAIVGGTGRLGMALAKRLSRAEIPVIIGSRDPAKAKSKATSLGPAARGFSNADAAAAGRVIILSIPYAAHRLTVASLAAGAGGKVVIDTAVPLVTGEDPHVDLPTAGSLAREAAALLPDAKVAAAFHTVSSAMLNNLEHPPHGDVLICADDADAKEATGALVRAVGLRPVDAGGLSESHVLEQIAGLLLVVNRRYRRHDLGITIAGLD